ncbi:MAG: RHS repeat-associated core domain-containing protein, partial [Myxococcota bacterium]
GSTNRAYIAGTDHLGAPLRLFNTTNGEIDWLADAEPFGAYWTHVPSSASDPSLEFNIRGSNQYFDAETGLHANWYRYYDPNTGRYITEDPLLRESPGFEQPSAAFAMNNPGRYLDPDGRSFVGDIWLCLIDPFGCVITADARSEAVQEVRDEFGLEDPSDLIVSDSTSNESSDSLGVGIPDDGRANAILHCVFSCKLTRERGAEWALWIGDEHERISINTQRKLDQQQMDLANNREGRRCGAVEGAPCLELCMRNTELVTLQ